VVLPLTLGLVEGRVGRGDQVDLGLIVHRPGGDAEAGRDAGPVNDQTQIDLIASADAALYQAKREGKNHVTVSGAW